MNRDRMPWTIFSSKVKYSGQDGGQVVVDFLEGLMGKIGERKRGNKRSLWLSEENSSAHQVVRQAPDKQKEQSSFDAATVANKEDAAYNEFFCMVSNQPVQDQFRVPSLVTSDSPKLFELSSRFAKRKRTSIEDSRTSQLLLDTETIATTTGGAPQYRIYGEWVSLEAKVILGSAMDTC
ncbi:hypothetical protein Tco_1467154 [Tanacetum coccineum]